MTALRPILAAILTLTFAAPIQAATLPDLTITSNQPGSVVTGQTFDHTITVTNIGGTAGKYQTTDAFSTAFDVVAIPAGCFLDTVLVRMRRQQAGVVCNGTLAPDEAVVLTETLRAKATSWSGSVVVNRALRSIVAESDYTNNAAFWAVTVLP